MLVLVLCGLSLIIIQCNRKANPLKERVRLLQAGKITDDSSFVYQLPYERGKTFRVLQGYFSAFSHKDRAAIDFNMKKGTRIAAARDGIVVRVKQDGDRGGMGSRFRKYGNNIVIEHADGSRAGYWHIQHNGALVKAGDTVKAGQVIALSGQTGNAAVPHLHFLVWNYDSLHHWQQVPTRFHTSDGIHYLKFWKKYKNE